MKTHTPGPWKVMPEEAHRDYIRVRGTRLGGQYKIANVCSMKLVGDGRSIEETANEARANARLIAAAPELLEALVALLAMSEECGQNYMRIEERNAHAAIAKATTP